MVSIKRGSCFGFLPFSARAIRYINMLLSIITLNYKKADLTKNCLNSLIQQFHQELDGNKIEIIVVDNNSQDGSVDKLTKTFLSQKNIRIVKSAENGGFGKGNNLGASKAKGDYLLFLNNDTTVTDKSLLEMAQYVHEHPEISICGGQLVNADGTLQASTGTFYHLFAVFLLLLGFQKFGLLDVSPKDVSQVDWVKGGLLMIKKGVFDKLHGFDERIFMYTEDMDLCFRAYKSGIPVYFYPFVKVTHAEHGSANRSFAIVNIYKGLLYFYKKHKNYLEYLLVKTLLLSKAYMVILLGTLMNRSDLVKTYKQAIQF